MSKPRKDQDWVDLYEYVKKEIMGYADDLKLPSYMILRLKGLSTGKFLANNKITPMANYDFTTILFTFKAYRQNIIGGFRANNTKFTNEQHKFNYSMVIVESNINDMVIRLKNAKRAKEKIINMSLDNQLHEGAEYKAKSKDINKSIKDLEELW